MPRSILSLLFISVLTQTISAKGTKYALLIGVSKYDPTQLKNLNFPERDATELAKTLIDRAGFQRKNVYLMTQTESGKDVRRAPTVKNIRRKLHGLINLCDKADTLVIAFAGHGVQFVMDKSNYFCPADADLTDKKTMINLQTEVYQQLEKNCDARVKLLFVDACRNDPRTDASRNAARNRKEIDLRGLNRPQDLKLPKGLAAFFSCQPGQISFEDKDLKHGVFFHFVIEGLKGKAANRDGRVTLPSLQDYVYSSVKNHVFNKFSETIQKPQLLSVSDDVIILIEQGKLVKEITNSIGMKLRLIPAGTFTMGSPKDEKERNSDEGPQHEVEITKPFYMGVYEVTQAQFKKVMGYNPSYFSRNGKEKAGAKYSDYSKPFGGKESVQGMTTTSFPVENVSWDEAVEFCKKLSDLASEKRAGRLYRLPTEAEWEYACRGGSKKYQVFAFGDSLTTKQANFAYELKRTCKVGSYQANGFGLFDMHGNVYEWCNDFYSDETYTENKRTDPVGPNTGDRRSLRGGSLGNYGYGCRSANRFRNNPGNRYRSYGFRVVFSVGK